MSPDPNVLPGGWKIVTPGNTQTPAPATSVTPTPTPNSSTLPGGWKIIGGNVPSTPATPTHHGPNIVQRAAGAVGSAVGSAAGSVGHAAEKAAQSLGPAPGSKGAQTITNRYLSPQAQQQVRANINPGVQASSILAGTAQAAGAAQHAAANLPGMAQVGQAKTAVANFPPVAAAGNVIHGAEQAVFQSRPAQAVAKALGGTWPAQQLAHWVNAHPQDANSILSLVNVWGDAGTILPLLGMGSAGLAIVARFAMKGATKDAAIQAGKDAAAKLATESASTVPFGDLQLARQILSSGNYKTEAEQIRAYLAQSPLHTGNGQAKAALDAARRVLGEPRGLVAKSLEKPPITRFDPEHPGEVIETPQESGTVTTARQGVGRAIHPLTPEGITGQTYPFKDRLVALSKAKGIAIPQLVAQITQQAKASGRSFDAVLSDHEGAATKAGNPSWLSGAAPLPNTTVHGRQVVMAVSGSHEKTFVEVGGRRFGIPQSNYGTLGRAIGQELILDDKSTLDADLVDRVLDDKGNVLYQRAPLPVHPNINQRIQVLSHQRGISSPQLLSQLNAQARASGKSLEGVLADQERVQGIHAGAGAQAQQATAEEATRKEAQAIVDEGTTQQTREQAQQTIAQHAVASNPGTSPITIDMPISPKLGMALRSEAANIDIKPVVDYLNQQHHIQQFTGDTADQLYALHQQSDESALRLRDDIIPQLGRSIPGQDWEAIYHAIEEESPSGLTPQQRSWYNVLNTLKNETENIKRTLPEEIQNRFKMIYGIGYIKRFALGKGSVADKLQNGKFVGKPGLLRTTTSAMKHRQYWSLTGPDGGRNVVSIVNNRILDAKGQFLGTMARMKTQEQLMEKDLAPALRRLDAIQQRLGVFRNWAERRPASINKQVDVLTKMMGEVTTKLADDLTAMSPELTRTLRNEQREIAQLLDSFKAASATGGKTAVSKFESLQNQLNKTRLAIYDIKAKYDPAKMKSRVFVGKDGNHYTLHPAKTREIEDQTDQRYYKNALVSVLLDHLETMDVARASQFLEHLKSDPEFLKVAMPATEYANQAKEVLMGVPGAVKSLAGKVGVGIDDLHKPGWKPTDLPQFKGWVMDPKVADMLNAAMPQNKDEYDIVKLLRGASQAAVNIGFFNPFIHTPNVALNWTIDRGTLRWISPRAWKRLAYTSVKAFNAATKLNSDYREVMREGGALMRTNGMAAKVRDSILEIARKELQDNPGVLQGMAAHYGITPRTIVNFPWWASHQLTWLSNDMAYLQRVFEHQMEGKDIQTAIRATERTIPNYRLPGRILGSSGLSRIFRDRGMVIFAPYHYGLLKGWGNMTKDLIRPGASAEERLEAASKLSAAGILLFSIAPMMDHVFQNLTGNRHAQVRRAGFLTPAYDLERYLTGTLPLDYTVESAVSPSPLMGSGMELFEQRNQWADPTLSPQQTLEKIGQVAFQGGGPLSVRQMIQQGTPWYQALATSPLYSSPKYGHYETALRSYLYNNRNALQGQANKLMQSGDTDKARDFMAGHNARARALIAGALKEEGVPDNEIPDMVERAMVGPGHGIPGIGLRPETPGAAQQKFDASQTPWNVSQLTQPRKRGRRARTYQNDVP